MSSYPYFYSDLYAKQLDVEILEYGHDAKYGPYLVLDRTIFHAHGGGQKGDRGTLVLNDAPFDGVPPQLVVKDTRGEKGGEIRHILDQELNFQMARDALPGTKATLHLDWSFRYTQMRLHSSAHLLHTFMERAVGHPLPHPKISDILEDHGLNVYDSILNLKPEDMPNVVSSMNEFIAIGHQITTYPDPQKPAYRYWQCEGVTIPCGGTHPKNTSEIGSISANLNSKKGQTKITFRLVESRS